MARKAPRARKLEVADVDSFMDAADRRRIPPQTKEQVIEIIKKKNSYRWWRLRHDYKWLRRQMKKLGLSPDDARELL